MLLTCPEKARRPPKPTGKRKCNNCRMVAGFRADGKITEVPLPAGVLNGHRAVFVICVLRDHGAQAGEFFS
jgi:hypothetical protein